MATPPPALLFAEHVQACWCDGQVIVLDLLRSKYLGFAGSQLGSLATVIQGWPAVQPSVTTAAEDTNIAALSAALLHQGLVTRRRGVNRRPPPPPGVHTLDQEAAILSSSVGAGIIWRVARSIVAASASLRFRSLWAITKDLDAQRARLGEGAYHASPSALGPAVGAYLRLRPLFLTAHQNCLQDSLSLVRLLTSEGIAASLVLGVATRPFRAHAWVQCGEIVVNDAHEHVRRFQPILAA